MTAKDPKDDVTVAVAQMDMFATIEDNLQEIAMYLCWAANEKADVVVFPELALTGFHRGVPSEVEKLKSGGVDGLEALTRMCREHNIAAWVGLPIEEGRDLYNSYVLISSNGDIVGKVAKVGLMASEHRIFKAGNCRPVIDYAGIRMSAVICREVGDLPEIRSQLVQDPDLLVWPGYVSNIVATDPGKFEDGTKEQAATVAKATQSRLLQCNWANAVNAPEREDLGGSSLIDKDGQIQWSAPWGTGGLAVIDLNSASCVWLPKSEARGFT